MDIIIEFSNSYGWLASDIEIILFVLLVGGFVVKYFKWWNKKRKRNRYMNLSSYVRIKFGDLKKQLTIIKKELSIGIIDDEPDSFPIDYLKQVGYQVDCYQQVSLSDADRLAKYDILFLDIAGVVKEDKESGGKHLIKRIRDSRDDAIIVAVSSRKFDPEANRFFSLADDTLNKPLTETGMEEYLEETIFSPQTPTGIADEVDQIIIKSNLTDKEQKSIITWLIAFFESDISHNTLKKKLRSIDRLSEVDNMLLFGEKLKARTEGYKGA